MQPWPSRPVAPRWVLIPYLLMVDIQNTALSYFHILWSCPLSDLRRPSPHHGPFCDRWPNLRRHDHVGPGSVAFLLPAAVIAIKYLSGFNLVSRRPKVKIKPQPPEQCRPFDLVRVPVLSALIGSKYFRVSMQALLIGLDILVVIDGRFGPQVGAMNLAGVLPWMHW